MDTKQMNRAADNLRILIASMVEKAKSGHPGGAMGGADFINVLYSKFLVYDPSDPLWIARDRFFLDPGHMSPMLYSVLAMSGFYTVDELRQFRQWGSVTPGHPELDPRRGVENSSGPLGQGHVMAVGCAIAERFLVQRFGDILDGKRTWQKELAQSNVKPTLKDAVAGDITAAMPYRAMTNIIEFIKMLDMVVPGFAANETLLYSPELKFYSNKVKMDENLDTNIQGLHCLGDSSGWTRGLMMASVMGVLMGRKLAEKEGC